MRRAFLHRKQMIFKAGLILAVALTTFIALPRPSAAEQNHQILFYYGNGCPHCAVVETYFNQNHVEDRFDVIRKEVYSDSSNAEELTAYFETYQVPENQRGVPFAIIDHNYYVGDQPIIDAITNFKEEGSAEDSVTPAATSSPATSRLNFAIVTGAALVDAINPCEFAVLIILMATVLATGNRRRALLSGLAFSFAIYLSYLAMGLGLYSAVAALGVSLWIQRIAGGLAVALGLLNLKDAIWYGKGVLMEVPLSWRPRMKSLLHAVTNPFAALGVGFIVSLFLLPCTSGPYIVIVGMLGKEATLWEAVRWLLYYNVIFILPMLLITLLVHAGLKPESLESLRQKRLRWLHAVAGLILLGLGIYLLV